MLLHNKIKWKLIFHTMGWVRFNVPPNTRGPTYRGMVLWVKRPTSSVKALKEDRVLRIRSQSHQVAVLHRVTRIRHICSMKKNKIHTRKHKWIHSRWYGPSVTKPYPQNCTNCSSKCAYDCAQLQHTIQHRTVLIISPLTSRQTS